MKLVTLHEIKALQNRYPFNEKELEILVRCNDHIQDEEFQNEDFLETLAFSSPYSYYFLPGDEMKSRVDWIEDNILPMGFPNQLRAMISSETFVSYANEGIDIQLERFLEGIACTGLRGPKEAINFLYKLAGYQPTATMLLDLSFRLAIASEALAVPNLNMIEYTNRVSNIEVIMQPMLRSLQDATALASSKEKGNCVDYDDYVTKEVFVDWTETNAPLLSTTLSTFIHNLIFHGEPYHEERIPFVLPKLKGESNILTSSKNSPLLFELAMASNHFSSKLQRLYSTDFDGHSFNRLQWSILGYEGPTLLIVKTTNDCILGGFAHKPWKESLNNNGCSECFLFQLSPTFNVYRPTFNTNETKFMYLHSNEFSPTPTTVTNNKNDGKPCGIGFGGSIHDSSLMPRFFIPDTFETCYAKYFDGTYASGNLLPEDCMEQFEIQTLEVWGVGTTYSIKHALQKRLSFRNQRDEFLDRARTVIDKTQFVKDLESGFIASKLFEHRDVARGRQEFRVDDKHGGYKIDRE